MSLTILSNLSELEVEIPRLLLAILCLMETYRRTGGKDRGSYRGSSD
jgi:hypothetical protein